MSRQRVLVVGVYLSDRRHGAVEAVAELERSRAWSVDQRWIAMGTTGAPPALQHVTVAVRQPPVPKFTLINELLGHARLDDYDYVLIVDDDVGLPDGFLDAFLDIVQRHDLALAQPARTRDSTVGHHFVFQIDGIAARRTRFVEIGPLVALRHDTLSLLTPFDETSPMGWGYDYVWPIAIERSGLRMGIVDATPVEHTMRPQVTLYDAAETRAAMEGLLRRNQHLSRDEAWVVVEAYA